MISSSIPLISIYFVFGLCALASSRNHLLVKKSLHANNPNHLNATLHSQQSNPSNQIDCAVHKIRGVNCGGWFLSEPFINPSLYNTGNPKIVDEYTFCKYLGKEEALKRLTKHWDTFYTLDDFVRIKSYGLNHIRIGIGFWAFSITKGEPYVQGQLKYLKRAVDWAKQTGLKVIITIHGAPGSQNGNDNSGQRGHIGWPDSPSNLARTKSVLAQLTNEFSQPIYAGVVTNIEALNEPAGYDSKTLSLTKKYYQEGYQIVRNPRPGVKSNLFYTISDAFLPLKDWSNFFPSSSYQQVALDTHRYSIFTPVGVRMNDRDRIQSYCNMIKGLKASQEKIMTFVGEFSPVSTDCTPMINGLGRGARYDGTFGGGPKLGSCQGKSGKASSFTKEYKDLLARLFSVQTRVYENSCGWIMWTFKTENADEWSYDAGVKNGWIPKDAATHMYPNPC
ncbi:hypothetical protein O181_005876 [Austropuccinia psidii MF-1]|uniref:Glycoside hydrolase family 5 domain-containing protein n=1 Tax=Austropuccinia psidii MF-1 TaxID=1389203 RepID=A0A9Q3BJQ8_9BASI|nr:hypothetical protein [Austropuccinia psidii MF-1]